MRWPLAVGAAVLLGLLAWRFLGGGALDPTDEGVGIIKEAAPAPTPASLPAELERLGAALSGAVGSVSAKLEGIDDEASARAALPKLKDMNLELAELGERAAGLPETARKPLARTVSTALEELRPAADRVLGLPAAGPVVEPVLRPMLETLAGLAG